MPAPALFGEYRHPHTNRWAETVASFDGFVFVTPEYNHSAPGALKNAIDFLFAEWNNKAAGFVSHGVHGGVRAVEHLRQVMTEVQVANVRTQVALSAFTDFETHRPGPAWHDHPGPAPGAHLGGAAGRGHRLVGALRTAPPQVADGMTGRRAGTLATVPRLPGAAMLMSGNHRRAPPDRRRPRRLGAPAVGGGGLLHWRPPP
ncbi:hypothetical protein GCM10020220_023660 [Nonomuraea rubra]|uniref:NADPH-dependent FMN reductase n=1 Tax=Nonomuraea rubra TaxID=46180 RepID=UPI0031E838D4